MKNKYSFWNNRYWVVGMCGACLMMTSCDEKEFTTGMPEKQLINSITLEVTERLPVAIGMDTTIVYSITPEKPDNSDLQWTTSNEMVAAVTQDGTITGKSEGTAIITVTPVLGFGVQNATMRTISVTVVPEIIKATDIQFTNVESEVYETDQLQLRYNILPADHTYSYLTWKSSDESIATVDKNGVVTGVKAGDVTIFAYTHDKSEVVGEYSLTVKGYVPAEDVTIQEPASEFLYLGQILDLDFTYTPESATASTVEWTSDNEQALTVSQGKVTAVGFGKATITATCTLNGKSSSVTLTVNPGWFVWDSVTNGFEGWTTTSGKVECKDGKLVVTVGKDGKGNPRADVKMNASETKPFNMHFGNYPIIALRCQKIAAANFQADFVTTKAFLPENGIVASSANCTPVDLADGTALVYCKITKSEVLVDDFVPYRSFCFKVTNIPADISTYDVYWIRTFRTEAEMREFCGIQ